MARCSALKAGLSSTLSLECYKGFGDLMNKRVSLATHIYHVMKGLAFKIISQDTFACLISIFESKLFNKGVIRVGGGYPEDSFNGL